MILESAVCAIIPMRKGSKRVIRKNKKDFNGKPLFHHILQTLSDVPEITSIIVDTNDQEIKDGISEYFPQVTIVDRPLELSSEFESVNNIIAYDIQFVKENIILQTHVTNPLVKADTFSQAIRKLVKNLAQYNALFSVTRQFERFWDEKGNPVNHNPQELIRTQDLPPFYVENSCIYIFTKKGFSEAGNNRLGTKRIMFEIDSLEAVDIDYPIDFKFAELLQKELYNDE